MREVSIDLRLVHTTVVENKTGICKRQACLLGLQIELHNLMVTYRKLITVKMNSFVHRGRKNVLYSGKKKKEGRRLTTNRSKMASFYSEVIY